MQSATLARQGSLSVSQKLRARASQSSQKDENIWKSILADASRKSGQQEPTDVIVLSSGTDIGHLTINSLQQVMELPEEERIGNANIASNVCFVVDFAHVELKDRSSEQGGLVKEEKRSQTASFWVINDSSRKDILLQQLRRRTMRYSTTAAIVCINLEEPWTIMEQLEHHTSLLEDILQAVSFADSKGEAMKSLEEKVHAKVKEFNAGTSNMDGSAKNTAAAASAGGKKTTAAGFDGPERNFGIPVLFCLCHAEAVPMIIENKRCVGWMDVISLYLRKYVLDFASPLFFIQQPKKKVANILYDYLGHALYNYPFSTPANTSLVTI